MTQQPYFERAAQVVSESSLAVLVLLSSENEDISFVRLKPQPANLIAPEDFAARKLRSVGVVGLHGTKPSCAFDEPLEPQVVNAIAAAFLEYVRVLLGEHIEAAMIAELERLCALSNTQPN